MILSLQINNQTYKIDSANPLDISILLNFNGAQQPNAYGVERATSKPVAAESLIGDTRLGGSCNFEQYSFIPHCNGTHTECVGHITNERISIYDCLKDVIVAATLVSIKPETVGNSNENYSASVADTDQIITCNALANALADAHEDFLKGLIIRTLPNDAGKQTKTYLEVIPPFFSTEAIEFIARNQIEHLLVDVPSIDRIFDEGKLSNHRIFWDVAPESFELNATSKINKTITEMIFVPDSVADGSYLLNLQIPAFVADAAPSRPVLFKVFE